MNIMVLLTQHIGHTTHWASIILIRGCLLVMAVCFKLVHISTQLNHAGTQNARRSAHWKTNQTIEGTT